MVAQFEVEVLQALNRVSLLLRFGQGNRLKHPGCVGCGLAATLLRHGEKPLERSLWPKTLTPMERDDLPMLSGRY